ncbi:MAG: methyltransferase family protein [Spirochaetota bacterium]
MNATPALTNLWIYFVTAYAIIWASMIWADKKRGTPIEDPELYSYFNKFQMILVGQAPVLLLLVLSVFIPVQSGPLFTTGISILITGVLLNLVAMYSFASSPGGLNAEGIYRFSRNPMYVGGILLITGLNVMGWSQSIISITFMAISIAWIGIIHWSVLKEESFLLRKYGKPYSEFMKRTSRYIGIPGR